MVLLVQSMAMTAAARSLPSPSLEPSPAPRRFDWSCPIDCCSLVCPGVAEDGFGLALCLHHGNCVASPRLFTTSVLHLTQELVPSPPPPHVPPWRPPWPPPYSTISIPSGSALPTMSSRHTKKASLAPGLVLGRSPEQLLVSSPQRKIGSKKGK